MPARRQLLILLALTVLLRLPFLNLAVQGDDVYYLFGAEHAQIDPLHPTHARYAFLGQEVDMRGHPHPPLNCWILAGLLAVFGEVREAPFHLAYLVFSLIAVAATWSVARRFTGRPELATLLFLFVPAFVVNGTSFESDLPFLAFWMAAAAFFLDALERRSRLSLAVSAVCLGIASLAAYQAVAAVPILGFYLWQNKRRWIAAWSVLATPLVVIFGWQLAERLSSGALPATVLAGYFETYNLQSVANKLRNAAALTGHLGWLVLPALSLVAFRLPRRGYWIAAAIAAAAAVADPNPLCWASIGCGVVVLLWLLEAVRRRTAGFLEVWVLLYFAGALVVFFAGSARYLLPLAAPVAILAVNRLLETRLSPWVLYLCVALQAALGISLAAVNARQWNAYRAFVQQVEPRLQRHRVWINSEFGLRFYAEQAGGLPVLLGQPVAPGEMVLSSDLAFPVALTTGGGRLVTIESAAIDTWLPFRLIGLDSRSAFSAAAFGLRPFDLVTAPIDRIRLASVVERKPVLSDLPMNSPEADNQIVSGVFPLEDGRWRWTGERAVLLLKAPATPSRLAVRLYLPPQSPARQVTLQVDSRTVAHANYTRDGIYTLESSTPLILHGDSASVEISVERTFSPPGDRRRLGLILQQVGFLPAP